MIKSVTQKITSPGQKSRICGWWASEHTCGRDYFNLGGKPSHMSGMVLWVLDGREGTEEPSSCFLLSDADVTWASTSSFVASTSPHVDCDFKPWVRCSHSNRKRSWNNGFSLISLQTYQNNNFALILLQ